jgi:hypothetical protein
MRPNWQWGEHKLLTFVVLEGMKGNTTPEVGVRGFLMHTDDFNKGSVPYAFVRSNGGKGNCVADGYKNGGEFLLLLRDGTPYWEALLPTSEQVRGADDPWVTWVRDEVRRQSR